MIDRQRSAIRNERSEEFGLDKPAKTETIDINGWVQTSFKTFKKNKIPDTKNDSIIPMV
jgi:hypothetical protein